MKRVAVALLILISAQMFVGLAQAQWVVFDPTNFAQNVIQVAREAEQVANQVHQLENEAQMIENQVKNLHPLDFNIVDRLRVNLAHTEGLLEEQQGLPYARSIVDLTFPVQYPQRYTAGTTREQMQADALIRWANSLDAVQRSVRMQAQAHEDLNDDELSLIDLVARSQGAYGNRDATQATNQLLALHAKQAIQEQRLRITEDRAAALEAARAVASEDKSRELRRRFMTTQTAYTPIPIHVGE